MSDSAQSSLIPMLARVASVALAVALVLSTGFLLSEGGLAAAIPGLLATVMALVLVYGVFTNQLFEPRVQVAFFVGVGAWAGYNYLFESGGVIDLLLLGLATLVVAQQARKL
jgi:hypothetical protein